jgi:type II secretory pathway predicted ATPase ExeA/predicted RNA binding protein with dsRBD fold (UPF0201 family)
MYESFYGITCRPFLADPDPGCCAGVGTMQRAYDELYNCFDLGKGIGILTGSAGTGKTLLCLKLLEDLNELFRGVFLAGASFSNRRSLLQAIMYALERPYRGLDEQELRVELITAAKKAKRTNRSIFLVVDEAHLLNETLLEEIRSATNLIENGESLVRVLLSGQMPLEETMTRPALDALNQRVGCHQSLETLTRQQSIDYIEFRFKRAGTNLFDVFTAESLQLITEAADGNPRCLNKLCDHALFLGYAEEEKPIETTTVRAALDDLKQLPLQWNDLLTTTDECEQSAPDSFSDNSFSDDFFSDESLIEEASAEPSATLDVEASREKTVVFEIGAEETEESAGTENYIELGASEEIDQFEESEATAYETLLESDQANSETDIESRVEENFAIQVSSFQSLIIPLEIDATNIGVTVNQFLDNQVSESNDSLETFAEVISQQKTSDAISSFEEEAVEDLYVRLDANKQRAFSRSNFAENDAREQTSDELVSTSFTQQEEFDQAVGVSPSSPDLQESPEPVWFSSDADIPVTTGPEQIIDQVVPLLNAAAELPVEEMPSETSQQDQEVFETNSTEIESESEDLNVVENHVGSTVFDTLLETQQADVSQLHQLLESGLESQPEATSKVLFSNGERLQLPVQFDVVQPEHRERFLRDEMVVHEPALPPETGSGHSNTSETATSKRPKYDQLFSELRRQRLA